MTENPDANVREEAQSSSVRVWEARVAEAMARAELMVQVRDVGLQARPSLEKFREEC